MSDNPDRTEAEILTQSPWKRFDALKKHLGVFQYGLRSLSLVWSKHRALAAGMLGFTVFAGVLPVAITYTSKLIVDAVVHGFSPLINKPHRDSLLYVAMEFCLVSLLALAQNGLTGCESLLRLQLSQSVNELILNKAQRLQLRDFEDSDFYDQIARAKRGAPLRPLSLVRRVYRMLQNTLSLVLCGGLLLGFSPWAAVAVLVSSIPSFMVETRFSEAAFRLFRLRIPEARMQGYLETLLTREDHVKEVRLFDLADLFLARYRDLFHKLFREERALAVHRGVAVSLLGLLTNAALYGVYAVIVVRTLDRSITLGDMTMYLLVFRQGQAALAAILSSIGGMYEDNLYLANLYEFLEHPDAPRHGAAASGPDASDGIRFEHVSFTYPGAQTKSLDDVTLQVPRGQKLAIVGENGAGKTTLIKLLTRLYEPSSGRILLDGLPLAQWDPLALRRRIGVIFQDFIRYQLPLAENIGVGDVEHMHSEQRLQVAGAKGMVNSFVHRLRAGYQTQLGRWFADGQDLSLGQWQKVALARAFMREEADILILDEPTAAMDPEAESEIFQRFRSLAADRMGIVISHRFSTVRMADIIIVLKAGRIVEQGSHTTLIEAGGHYARLFNLQAEGYR